LEIPQAGFSNHWKRGETRRDAIWSARTVSALSTTATRRGRQSGDTVAAVQKFQFPEIWSNGVPPSFVVRRASDAGAWQQLLQLGKHLAPPIGRGTHTVTLYTNWRDQAID
jgi:hypothetical protein